MKRNLLYLLMFVCSMSLFTACSDDDGDTGAFIEQELVGVYKGGMDINLSISSDPLVEDMLQKVYISKYSNDAIQMEIKDFTVALAPGGTPMSLGNIKVENCAVTGTSGSYSFEGAQILTLNTVGECNVKVAGTIVNKKLKLQVNVAVKAPQMTVSVAFDGDKLATDQSSEAKILDFGFANVKGQMSVTGNILTYTVEDVFNPDIFVSAVPKITVSEKASVQVKLVDEDDNTTLVAVTEPQNFNAPVTFVITSEDGITVNEYIVTVVAGGNSKFTFENWGTGGMYPDIPVTIGGWATCNDAVGLIKNLGFMGGIEYTGEYPIKSTTESHSGTYAAELISVDTKGGDLVGQKVPKVTAGSMFLGTFSAMAAVEDPMKTTSFGIMYDKKPLKVKGYFKYKPGSEFYNDKGNPVLGRIDKCAISAVLYTVANKEETLDGSNIYNSDKIVAQAMYTYDQETAEYMPFELSLTYKANYDASKLYKFAVIFSASEDGANYNAAVGSKLLIDDVEIITE